MLTLSKDGPRMGPSFHHAVRKEPVIMDWITVLVSLITAGFAFLGVYMSNRKQAALVAYRLEKLEEKVDKHNNLVERMYRLEGQVETLKEQLEALRKA